MKKQCPSIWPSVNWKDAKFVSAEKWGLWFLITVVGVFYCPSAMEKLQSVLQNLSAIKKRSSLPVGHFNCPSIEWGAKHPKLTDYHTPSTILIVSNFIYAKTDKTMLKNRGFGNLIDLVLTSKPHFIRNVRTASNVSEKCDHISVNFSLLLWSVTVPKATKYVWRINHDTSKTFQDSIEVANFTWMDDPGLLDVKWQCIKSNVLSSGERSFHLSLVPLGHLIRSPLIREAGNAIKRLGRASNIFKKTGNSKIHWNLLKCLVLLQWKSKKAIWMPWILLQTTRQKTTGSSGTWSNNSLTTMGCRQSVSPVNITSPQLVMLKLSTPTFTQCTERSDRTKFHLFRNGTPITTTAETFLHTIRRLPAGKSSGQFLFTKRSSRQVDVSLQ